jgi:hypothetical protein
MIFITRQEHFQCEHCHAIVQPLPHGSYRNHCPRCLYSKHVDAVGPGDRASMCHGLMEPLTLDQDGKRGWMIIHRCVACGKQIPNRAAPDDQIIEFMESKSKGGDDRAR